MIVFSGLNLVKKARETTSLIPADQLLDFSPPLSLIDRESLSMLFLFLTASKKLFANLFFRLERRIRSKRVVLRTNNGEKIGRFLEAKVEPFLLLNLHQNIDHRRNLETDTIDLLETLDSKVEGN